jgi:hypothetical protein
MVGIQNSTMANVIHATASTLIGAPHLPRPYGACATFFLPRKTEIATGVAFDRPRQITLTLTNALKAVDDPR